MADLINLTALAAPTSILASKDTSDVIKQTAINFTSAARVGTDILSGALTGGSYAELVSLSTPGWLRFCGVYTIDGTSRTVGLKIVIDGTTVFDEVSGAFATADNGFTAVGITQFAAAGGYTALESFRFNSSLSISIKSSITETDKIALKYLTAI